MKNIKLHLFLFLFSTALFAQNKDQTAIMQILNNQVAAWNKGDTKTFMIGYWESDSLMYIGKGGIKYGYKGTLESYYKNYPDKAAMGTLKFDILEMKPMGRKHYLVVGKWFLTRPEKGDIGGLFSLVFNKKQGKWVIIADHSS
jgi:Domain of unknown function (DUF4440)